MAAEPSPRPTFEPDFRVGDWLVEPSLDRLSRGETVRHLRPQLTNLLVVLARHAGKTVSKDEILNRVWEGQYVVESGMTRCIAEIRQALEDDAREPKVLETIPKRGYRLVAPVVFLGSGAADAKVEPALPDAAPVPVATGGREPAAGDGDTRPAPRPVSARLKWASGSALVSGLLVTLAWSNGGWSPPPVLKERETVLLADVRNTTGDAAFDHTLRLALAVQLEQAPFLHILPPDQVRASLSMMGRSPNEAVMGPLALEVCRREGAAVLLAGSIARLGSRYALGLEAIGCRTGDTVGRALVEVDNKDAVLTALGTAAAQLRRRLGESRESLGRYDVPVVRATTPSLEALEALSLGDLYRDHARMAEALTFYRRATELDPQFAVAWARRGAAARNLGMSVAEERFGAADEPTQSIRRAFELRDRVSEPERLYILSHYYRLVEGDPFKALEIYQVWKRTYPGAMLPANNLASLYANTFGRYDAALPEAREAVRLAPYSSIATKLLVVAYLGLNRLPEARQALREVAQRGPGDAFSHGLAFQLAFLDADDGAMEEQARWAAGDRASAVLMTQYRALAAAAVGRLSESRRLWAEAASLAAQLGPPNRQAGIRLAEAEAEALLGTAPRARAAAEAALAVDRATGTLLSAAVAFGMAGDAGRARRLLDEAARGTTPGICSKFVWRPVGSALVESAERRFEKAREALHAAIPFERGRDFGLAPLAVRASIELSAGQAMQAAGLFQQLLDIRAVVPTSPWVAFARLGLARALRDAGDIAASRAAYDAVIGSLRNPDADAPLLVAARRERAALPAR